MSHEVFSNFSKMNTAEVMDRVFDVYRKSFFKQLGFSAIVGVIAFVLIFAITVMMLTMGTLFFAFFAITGVEHFPAGNAAIIPAIIFLGIMVLLYLLWQSVASAGHILLSEQAFYGRAMKLQFGNVLAVAVRVFSAFLAQVILVIPVIALAGGAFYLSALLAGNAFQIAVFAAGFFGVIVYLNIFLFAVAVAIFENRMFMKAIQRSWELVRGEFWKLFGIRVLWFMVIMVITYATYGLLAVGGMIANFELLFALINIILGFAIMPLDGIMQAVLYFNQRIKREGLDLEIKLEHLISSPPPERFTS